MKKLEGEGMGLDRRRFVGGALAALVGITSGSACAAQDGESSSRTESGGGDRWDALRRMFPLSEDVIHMSAMLIASHPKPVREAIERYRRELDTNPVTVLEDHNVERQERALRAAADYLGGEPDDIALTQSTTMGIGLVYNGLTLEPGDEILTTERDYYATHEALRLAAEKTGAEVRRVKLYGDSKDTSVDEIVGTFADSLSPRTRLAALTWVSSWNGLKLPLAELARVLERANEDRPEERRILLCVDGVHGFGIESARPAELGCDFFMAGAHKWLFGPRGTGVVWGSERGWRRVKPTIPSFLEDESWVSWLREEDPDGPTNGRRLSPGGFKAFEHQWAMTEAFELHQRLGKENVERRTHQLASRLKEGLAAMDHVVVETPMSPELSSGIVCFDVAGLGPDAVLGRLRERGVIATITPYSTRYPRLAPSIRNTEEEVDRVLGEIERLGQGESR